MRGLWARTKGYLPYAAGVALVLAVSVVGQPLRSSVHPANMVMFYLMVIVFIALRWGLGPAVVAAACSAFAFNLFFVPPYFVFALTDPEYSLAFVGLLAVGSILSAMAVNMRNQAETARHREDETAALYALSQELTVVTEMDDLVRAASAHINRALPGRVEIILPGGFEALRARPDAEIVRWVYQRGAAAGRGTPHFAASGAHYHPLKTLHTTLGVMVLSLRDDAAPLAPAQQRLLAAYANLIALAIERIQFVDKAKQAELLQEKERLQAAILSSISHDLRTPLASITGVLSSMLEHRSTLDPASQDELLRSAWAEARRLNRLVANLLDMSRLDSGAIKTSFDYCDLQDLIGVVLSNVENGSEQRRITVQVDDNVPLVRLDFTLFERVLVNVLDNAFKYSPPDAPVELSVRREGRWVRVLVVDRGPGIPPEEREKVFERFYRTREASTIDGAGLGLAICKGIVELHGGKIEALPRPGGGAMIQIDLPLDRTPDGQR